MFREKPASSQTMDLYSSPVSKDQNSTVLGALTSNTSAARYFPSGLTQRLLEVDGLPRIVPTCWPVSRFHICAPSELEMPNPTATNGLGDVGKHASCPSPAESFPGIAI